MEHLPDLQDEHWALIGQSLDLESLGRLALVSPRFGLRRSRWIVEKAPAGAAACSEDSHDYWTLVDEAARLALKRLPPAHAQQVPRDAGQRWLRLLWESRWITKMPLVFDWDNRGITVSLTDPKNTQGWNLDKYKVPMCVVSGESLGMGDGGSDSYESVMCFRGEWPYAFTVPGMDKSEVYMTSAEPSYPVDMRAGKHFATFTICRYNSQGDGPRAGVMLGVTGTDFSSRNPGSPFGVGHNAPSACMFNTASGLWTGGCYNGGLSALPTEIRAWPGSPAPVSAADQHDDEAEYQEPTHTHCVHHGYVVGLLLDLDQGSMAVYINGTRCGLMVSEGLVGPKRWVVDMNGVDGYEGEGYSTVVHFEGAEAPPVSAEVLEAEQRTWTEPKCESI